MYMLAVFTFVVSTLCVVVLYTKKLFLWYLQQVILLLYCGIYIKYVGAVCNKFVRRISPSTLPTWTLQNTRIDFSRSYIENECS